MSAESSRLSNIQARRQRKEGEKRKKERGIPTENGAQSIYGEQVPTSGSRVQPAARRRDTQQRPTPAHEPQQHQHSQRATDVTDNLHHHLTSTTSTVSLNGGGWGGGGRQVWEGEITRGGAVTEIKLESEVRSSGMGTDINGGGRTQYKLL